ncbi:uncharacterized protein [Oryza sativa Japonica Group]|uniref:uncharacterized protein n=1 Tax=Oryza sativa subsp. japonica TaxID=39947 RepID=UPI00339BE0B2
MGDEAAQALELMERMIKLKEQGLQGEQITRHFIKSRLAPIKARSRTAFEFDGKHDPNREDPDSLDFEVMKERMYKIFSNAIVVSYSHLLPVVPYNEFALMKSDPPIAQRRSPRLQTGQESGGPKIRKPSDIDPSGKDSYPTNMETGSSKETGPTAKDHPSDNQPATDNVEPSNEPPTGSQSAEAGAEVNQEPPTRNQSDTGPSQEISEVEAQAGSPPGKDASNGPGSRSPVKAQESTRPRREIITGPMIGDEEEILRIRAAEDSRPPILVKWWDNDGIVINKQKEDEEVCLLKKALSQATRIVNRIHLRNEAKTATLEKLVPHLGTLEATRNQLHEAKELARKTKHDLRDRIAEVQESNFELSGSSKVQAAKISQLEKQIQTLENDKAELARQRDSALKDVEDRKIKSQAQFDILVGKIKRLERARDEVANAATPLEYIRCSRNLRQAEYGTSEEAALDLINDAQKAIDKVAVDVVERLQDTDLRPTGPDNSDDEKTDTN